MFLWLEKGIDANLVMFISCLIIVLCFICGLGFAEPPGGGSNYVMYSIGDYIRNATPAVWYTPWELRPTIGTFHLAPEVVEEEMQTMITRGQDGITLVLWYSPLAQTQGLENVYGHVVNSSGGVLSTQHQQNLANIMQLISKVGFKRVFFRFATQFTSHPFLWSSWEEAQYLENYAFQKMVREIIYANFDTSKIPLLFDLCLEVGGMRSGQSQNYTQRMWSDYTTEFGASDTYGFTLAYNQFDQRIAWAMEVYDSVGIRPQMYAFDFYGNEASDLKIAYQTLVNLSESHKPILIQECYLNDVETYTGLMSAIEEAGITTLVGIFQWPLARSSDHVAFSVDYGADYTAYLYNVSGAIQAYPNPSTLSSTSNITWQSANLEEPCVFISSKLSPQPKLISCSTTGQFPLINNDQDNTYFYFELRQSNDQDSLLVASVNVTYIPNGL